MCKYFPLSLNVYFYIYVYNIYNIYIYIYIRNIDFIKENPDCNKDEIAADILLILKEIAEADGILHENEKSYLDQAYKILSDKNISFEQVSSQISSITKKITKVSLPEVKLPKVNMPKMEMPNFLNRDKK